MRVFVVLCLLTIPMMTLGWPSPWVVVCAAFSAGFISRRPSGSREAVRRPGYLPAPVRPPVASILVERVGAYGDGGLPDPQAFGLPLERPAFGDCEGCGGS